MIATTGDNGLLILKLEPRTSYRLSEDFLGSYTVEPLDEDDLADALAAEAEVARFASITQQLLSQLARPAAGDRRTA